MTLNFQYALYIYNHYSYKFNDMRFFVNLEKNYLLNHQNDLHYL